jgi:hypothetical protein
MQLLKIGNANYTEFVIRDKRNSESNNFNCQDKTKIIRYLLAIRKRQSHKNEMARELID